MLCRKIFIATISAYLFAGAVISRGIEVPAPSNLRIEYLGDPAVIDAAQPRFSWILSHPERNQAQKAFQVLVSAHPEASEGDVWDSGKVMSPASTQVVYAGKALESNRTYFWRVRWWDVEDRVSPYSRVARFDTGLLRSEDWHASWIGGENQLRKEFILTAAPRRARAYVSSLGWY
jgi:alpha-L-rhamnosidase